MRKPKISNLITSTSLVAAVTAAAFLAEAQTNVPKPRYPYEKCYGIAKAGENDCFGQGNSCGSRRITIPRRGSMCLSEPARRSSVGNYPRHDESTYRGNN